jgi:hypothetical protein
MHSSQIGASGREKKLAGALEPKPVAPKEPVRDLLAEIFQGRKDFFGWTPD